MKKRKVVFCCLSGVVVIGFFCAFVIALLFWFLFSSEKLDMNNPRIRANVQDVIGFRFPPSVEWKQAWTQSYSMDYDLSCHFTLPKKDVDLMFPPGQVEWKEGNSRETPEYTKKYFSNESLNHFKTAMVDYTGIEDKNRPNGILEITLDNSAKSDDDRVDVFVYFFSI